MPNQQPTTHKQARIDLLGSIHNRDSSGSKDQRFVNLYPETTKNPNSKEPKKFLTKRAGLTLDKSVVSGTNTARGLYYYKGYLYSVFGDKLYKDMTEILTLATSTGSVGWSEATGVVPYLFLCDGTNAYVIDSAGSVTQVNQTYTSWATATSKVVDDIVIPTSPNGFYYKVTATSGSAPYTTHATTEPIWPTTLESTIVDNELTWTCTGSYGGFPTPHIPKPVFLDGYIFLIDSGTSDIYNSDLENPLGWSASNFIAAEMWPDTSTALARQNNQVVVFGQESIEFMYDAATSDSPLARNDGAGVEIGLAGADTVFQDEKQFIFVGQSGLGGRAVWRVEGFQPKKISYEGIERILEAEGSSITSAKAFGVRSQGHYFYVLNLTSKTLVYDIDENMWHEWSTYSGGTHTKFTYSYATDDQSGKAILQHNTTGKTYKLDPSVYQDGGVSILSEFWTSRLDFGNINRKFMYSLNLVGDTTTASSTIEFRWSDDDYKTWSNWKSIDLVTRPYFMKLGYFRRRAFNFKHSDNTPLRLEALEFDMNIGIS